MKPRKMPADVAAALAFLRNPDGKGETRVFSGFSGGPMQQIGGHVGEDTPSGTPVTLTRDDGTTLDTRTTSKAFLVGHRLVVHVEGVSGYYLASRCRVRTEVSHG